MGDQFRLTQIVGHREVEPQAVTIYYIHVRVDRHTPEYAGDLKSCRISRSSPVPALVCQAEMTPCDLITYPSGQRSILLGYVGDQR